MELVSIFDTEEARDCTYINRGMDEEFSLEWCDKGNESFSKRVYFRYFDAFEIDEANDMFLSLNNVPEEGVTVTLKQLLNMCCRWHAYPPSIDLDTVMIERRFHNFDGNEIEIVCESTDKYYRIFWSGS